MSSRARRVDATVATSPFPWPALNPVARPDRPDRHDRHLHEVEPPAAPAPVPVPAAAAPPPQADASLSGAARDALEREAFASGYEQGERAGAEAGRTRVDASLKRLGGAIEELVALRRAIVSQTESQLVQLALAIAKRIIRREVAIDRDIAVAMARVALDRLGESHRATIRLHPEDFAHALQREGPEWAGAHVTVVADPAIDRGGCRVESALGMVDAGMDAQIDELARVLLLDEPATVGVPVAVSHVG